ncbi:apolipoprotein N-acyltransferase [Propionibacteriaceae bacterium G1746]|uniref:apolipoprotein N-acyltransferase n=1 Tax=Aestuariimicrobium sp. G57 TaxID=3418485 RepID=UPI003C259130
MTQKPQPVRLVAPVGALLAGALVSMAFAPLKWWPLAPLGIALFTVVLRWGVQEARSPLGRGARWGYLMGLSLFTLFVGWISVLGWYVGAALCLFMAVWGLLIGWGTSAVRNLPAWPVLTAAMWSLAEFASSRVPFGGFGWMRLGFTTADSPLGGLLPWIGVGGVSFLVALSGTLLAWGVERVLVRAAHASSVVTWRRALLPVGLVAAIFAVGPIAGLAPARPATGAQVHVGMVQGNVDGTAGSEAMGYARSVTNNHLSETIMLMAKARVGATPMPDFVLWPENSTDIDPTRDVETAALINEAVKFAEKPIFVGSVMAGPGKGERQTTGLWVHPEQGIQGRYDKRNLVPFGEFIPLRDTLLPLLPILEQVGNQAVPGNQPGVLDVPLGVGTDATRLRIGDVICFELAWDSTVYDTATNGAQLLVVQSNNATYTATGQPRQQFEMTRVRAMELRREIVVSTTSSFSGYIDARGRVIDKTRESTSASATYTVPLRAGATPAVIVGPAWELVAAVVAALGLVAGVVLAVRGRAVSDAG